MRIVHWVVIASAILGALAVWLERDDRDQ